MKTIVLVHPAFNLSVPGERHTLKTQCRPARGWRQITRYFNTHKPPPSTTHNFDGNDAIFEYCLKGDTSFFEKYYADDAMIIRGFGRVYTKTQDIENLKSGALKFEAYDVHERKIHTYGDTAVVSFRASAKGLGDGKPFSGDFRVSWVWVKQKGNWKLALYQVTQ